MPFENILCAVLCFGELYIRPSGSFGWMVNEGRNKEKNKNGYGYKCIDDIGDK